MLIITDGDADRLGVGDEKGNFIDQLRVYALLAYYLLEVKGFRGPIVKTLSTTTMLNKLGKIYQVPVYDTGVGFKYISPKMLETDAMIGGEKFRRICFSRACSRERWHSSRIIYIRHDGSVEHETFGTRRSII